MCQTCSVCSYFVSQMCNVRCNKSDVMSLMSHVAHVAPWGRGGRVRICAAALQGAKREATEPASEGPSCNNRLSAHGRCVQIPRTCDSRDVAVKLTCNLGTCTHWSVAFYKIYKLVIISSWRTFILRSSFFRELRTTQNNSEQLRTQAQNSSQEERKRREALLFSCAYLQHATRSAFRPPASLSVSATSPTAARRAPCHCNST